MAYTTPRTWITGDDVTAARINQDLRDNVSFLATPPSCRVFNSANISHVTSGTDQALTFDSERWDSQVLHSTSVNTGRLTAPVAGKYMIGAHIEFAANATGFRALQLRVNGTTVVAPELEPTTNGATHRMSVTSLYTFSAADYFEVIANQTSGGALNILVTGNYSPEAWMLWVSL